MIDVSLIFCMPYNGKVSRVLHGGFQQQKESSKMDFEGEKKNLSKKHLKSNRKEMIKIPDYCNAPTLSCRLFSL